MSSRRWRSPFRDHPPSSNPHISNAPNSRKDTNEALAITEKDPPMKSAPRLPVRMAPILDFSRVRTREQRAQQGPAKSDSSEDPDYNHELEELLKEYARPGLVASPEAGSVLPDDALLVNDGLGLSEIQVLASRKKYGKNVLSSDKMGELDKVLLFFRGPIVWGMLVALLIAAGLRKYVDLGVILGMLLLNAAVGYLQEHQAGNAVAALRKGLALKAIVLRDSMVKEVDATDLVVGDVVQIEEGTIIPADGKIIHLYGEAQYRIQIDQSAITGESLAVSRTIGDDCFSGSTVRRHAGRIVIRSVGDKTMVGNTTRLVNEASKGNGHFARVLTDIGHTLLFMVAITCFAVFIACSFRDVGILLILEYILGILVVGIPIGLPAVVTTTLAVGSMFLAKREAIVQKLSAIESLAGVDVLCSDKTGTLTKNALALQEPYLVPGVDKGLLLLTGCLVASHKVRGIDPIDEAFLRALAQLSGNILVKRLLKHKILDFQPFDPVSKKVQSTVLTDQGETIICVKGAPKQILDLAIGENSVSPNVHAAYIAKVEEYASRALRSLGVARKLEGSKWEILGIVPCSDPLRDDTISTIKQAKLLGLGVKMLTGDALAIAKEVALQIGMGSNIYDAERLGVGESGNKSGSEVSDFVEHADGFAGVFPQHKYNVVEILQNRGHLVAMTGDGVNDAPSLRKADTGIAVEGATDAARCAADIVFTSPGLGAIIDAIKTARQIFHRMYSYIVYRIALSIHLEVFFGLWIIILNQSLRIELIVFIAIFSDIATLTIAYDSAPFSKTPVKWNTPKIWGKSLVLGAILAAGSWITLGTMIAKGENGGIVEHHGVRDEVIFLQICLTQNWLIFITRSGGKFWEGHPSWQLALAVLLVDVVATCFCLFGIFMGPVGEHRTSIIAVVRIWMHSLGVFALMAIVYCVLDAVAWFDDFVNEGMRRGGRRGWKDLELEMQRETTHHIREENKPLVVSPRGRQGEPVVSHFIPRRWRGGE